MQINLYGKCDNCGEQSLPVIEVQDTSSYGSWVGLCARCLQSAQQMLALDAATAAAQQEETQTNLRNCKCVVVETPR